MDLSYRLAAPDDLPRIVAIYNATIPSRQVTADLEPVSVESRRRWFDEHQPNSRPLWVVDLGGQVAAWLSFSSFYGRPAYRRTAEISVYVDAPWRRHGVGRYLLQQAIACAPGLQLDTLVGFVFGHNAPSLGLFERMGFERWGHLPRVAVLDGVERDVVILGLRVVAPSQRPAAGRK
jgi:phosphinothricin acetyltransferase